MSSFLDSVVQITNSDPEDDDFGTGFIINHNEQVTYILTCAHVVNAIGETKTIQIGDVAASVVALGQENSIDFAILSVAGLQDKPVLRLRTIGKTGDKFTIVGSQSFKSQRNEPGFLTREIHGSLGGQIVLGPKKQLKRIEAWDLKIIDDYQLEEGHSGSPVIEDTSGRVIGVLSMREGGKKGIAIAVKALKEIWPDMPASLFQEAKLGTITTPTNEADGTQREVQIEGSTAELLTQEERLNLITLLCELPNINYANVRHSLVSTLPAKFQSNIDFDKPLEDHITEIVELVISDAQFQLPNGSYPVIVLIQNALNMMKSSQLRDKLQLLLNNLKDRLEVVSQINVPNTSLDRFKQYLDNFILQIPALEYELGHISDSLCDSVASPECKVVSEHLNEICTQLLEIDIVVQQSRDTEVVLNRFQLTNALADFNQQATIVQRNIEHFCMANEVVLEEDQTIKELEKIQQQLDILMLRYTTLLKTARKLFSDLLGSK